MHNPESQFLRWSTVDGTLGLETLASVASFPLNIPVVSLNGLVLVQNFYLWSIFTDSSANVLYNINRNSIGFTGLSNLDFSSSTGNGIILMGANSFMPLNALVSVGENVAGTIAIGVTTSGGDVLRDTGITPAVGDTMYWQISVSYYSNP
jgi:hypothetical protein